MESVIDWVKGILGCILVLSLVLQGIAGKAYSPYIRLFMGIVLILTVLSPITDLTGISGKLEAWMGKLAFREDSDLTDKLLQGDAWIEEQIMKKAEEFAAEASQPVGESEGEDVNSTDNEGINIKVEVDVEPVEPIVPAGRKRGK